RLPVKAEGPITKSGVRMVMMRAVGATAGRKAGLRVVMEGREGVPPTAAAAADAAGTRTAIPADILPAGIPAAGAVRQAAIPAGIQEAVPAASRGTIHKGAIHADNLTAARRAAAATAAGRQTRVVQAPGRPGAFMNL
ncbi:MAG TPA: hypothetical protein VGR89_06945, partial [Puia sp.]|nr:hypothetical protein [Puia sp.]